MHILFLSMLVMLVFSFRRCLPRSNLILSLVQLAVTQILHLLIYYLSYLIPAAYRYLPHTISHKDLKGNLVTTGILYFLPCVSYCIIN